MTRPIITEVILAPFDASGHPDTRTDRLFALIERIDEIKSEIADLGHSLPDGVNIAMGGVWDDLDGISDKLALAIVKMGEKS